MLSVIEWRLLSLNKILPKRVSPKSDDAMSRFLSPFAKGRGKDCIH